MRLFKENKPVKLLARDTLLVYLSVLLGKNENEPWVSLACAHPAKFGEAIQNALGEPPQLPEELMQLESLPTRCEILEARSETVKQHIETVLDGS